MARTPDRNECPLTAEVVARRRPYDDVLTMTRHELWHVFGLDHDDDPASIMSNRIEDRLPEYEHHIEVLEAVEASWESRNKCTRANNDGIGRWNEASTRRRYPRFERARER
jgi:hypothetical protein